MSDLYGLTAVPASAAALTPSNAQPSPVSASALSPPDTPLSARIQAYAQYKLPAETFRHSMRVYAYGLAIGNECFPEWHLTGKMQETWFCTAMLHDIGTTDENIQSTKLSYEFFAGVLALQLLQDSTGAAAPREQAESVAEAIFRHQDVQDKGMVSLMTQLIQLGTLLDNIGAEVPSRWVAQETIDLVNEAWPRDGWSGCFKSTVEREKQLKPYAMVSRIEGFEDLIMSNERTAIPNE
jgi:cyanamide hydratase